MKKNYEKNNNEQLKKELIENNYNLTYSYLIITLLNKNILNKLTNKITDSKTKIKITTLIKKNYLSGNEQFLYLLNNFIYTFKEDFYFINTNFNYIIETLLQNEKHTKYLLCKKYIGNNKYLPYFSYNIKKLIVYGFYNNIKYLAKNSELIKTFTKETKISTKKNMLSNKKGVEILYNTLLKLSICNAKELNNILLFEDIKHYIEQTPKNSNSDYKNIKKSILKYYLTNWESMINNYYQKIDILNILLK